MKRILALILMGIILFTPAQAEYIGSVPAEDVYVVQTRQHTCTLIAATMMLRNYACQNGSVYGQVTESAVRKHAWNNLGLKWDFSIGMVNVQCSHDVRNAPDKKAYLIECLRLHPEGIVIYDAGAPHAVWLYGYDEETDTFYCADTTTEVAGRGIRLEESILRGETQEDKIAALDRIWYIAGSGSGAAGTPLSNG